jgi:hypothetical protein
MRTCVPPFVGVSVQVIWRHDDSARPLHDAGDGQLPDVRFVHYRFGEDVNKVVAQFWKEHTSGDFSISPAMAYGAAPRMGLCSKASLTEALKTAFIVPDSITEQQWRKVCEHYGVAWPTRLRVA